MEATRNTLFFFLADWISLLSEEEVVCRLCAHDKHGPLSWKHRLSLTIGAPTAGAITVDLAGCAASRCMRLLIHSTERGELDDAAAVPCRNCLSGGDMRAVIQCGSRSRCLPYSLVHLLTAEVCFSIVIVCRRETAVLFSREKKALAYCVCVFLFCLPGAAF